MENLILPGETNISAIHLNILNIRKAASFYEEVMLFKKLNESDEHVSFILSGGSSQVIISETKNPTPNPKRSTGLFHVAYRVEQRKELAFMLQHISRLGYEFQGFSDHGVSEALYLADPDGNGIEIYWDKPKQLWHWDYNSKIKMSTEPLDLQSLLQELNHSSGTINPSFTIGHLHLKVSGLEKAEQFYHNILSFDITQSDYPGALFMSAGGYHHHLGFNTWLSKNGEQPHSNSIGLKSFTINIPDVNLLDVIAGRLSEAKLHYTLNEESSIQTKDFDGNNLQIEFIKQKL